MIVPARLANKELSVFSSKMSLECVIQEDKMPRASSLASHWLRGSLKSSKILNIKDNIACKLDDEKLTTG